MKTSIVVDSLGALDIVVNRCRSLFEAHGPQEVIIQNYEQNRRVAQNRLAFFWYKFLAMEMGDESPKAKRAYCKLCIGVPIMREDDEFRDVYDRVIRPLTYEQKLECMVEPIDFPITRNMTLKQMTRYLNDMEMHFAGKGVILPKSDDLYYQAMGIKKAR